MAHRHDLLLALNNELPEPRIGLGEEDEQSPCLDRLLLTRCQHLPERLHQLWAERRIDRAAGGGMVTVTVSGHKQLQSIKIDPEVVSKDDVEMLQDLIVAAVSDAHRKVDEALASQMQGMMGGLRIPGMS